MSIDRCDICKEFIFSFEKEHKCKPKWECRIGDEDFEHSVYAVDAEQAAEKCADEQESDWDYSFVDEGGVDIGVKNSETGEIVEFYVQAEAVIEYRASKKNE